VKDAEMVNTVMVAGRFVRLGNLHPANRYEHIAWLRMGMQTTWKQNWFPARGEAPDED